MKRLISVLLAAALLLSLIPAGVVSALPDEYIDYDGPQYYEDEEGYTHFAYFGSPSQSPTSFTVPGDVEIIDAYAFSGTNVRTVVLPDSVVMMEDFAFSSSQVQSITVGAGLAKADGLMGCYSLRSITVSPDNPYLRSEGNCVINRQSNVLEIGCSQSVIPDDGSITGIAPYAFHRNSPSVASIPDGVEWIGEEAFSGSASRLSYLSKITFPDSLKSIDKRAFYNCDTLASVTLPDHVMEIGAAAFEGTKYYNTAANWTDNVLYIGKHVIAATIVGDGAIKEGTLSIAAQAFSACGEATSIALPESVQYIGPRAFLNCRSLMRAKLPSQLTAIPTGLFYNCTGLVSVILPPQVDSVGEEAFYGCSSLIAIALPDGVQSIGSEAFYGCTELRTITLPDGVTSVGNAAFEGTAYYNNADNWENDVLYIGRYLIKAKTTLDGAYTVKGGTIHIATNAFRECKTLTDITIPRGVTHIGDGAFYDCVLLNGVVLPVGVVNIGDGAFYHCSQMRAVVVLDGVTAIGDQAFYRCLSLAELSLPATVTTVGTDAFYYCASLENVYYSGTQAEKEHMTVSSGNTLLNEAMWHYEQDICPQHAWDNVCDTECNVCGGEREVTHTWDDACDTECNVCGEGRDVTHTYDHACDAACNVCGAPRTVGAHVYADDRDADCDVCGAIRKITRVGDVDGSGKVDSTDARLVLQYAVGKIGGEALDLTATDVDGSGKTDSTDARLILQFAVGKITKFPAA